MKSAHREGDRIKLEVDRSDVHLNFIRENLVADTEQFLSKYNIMIAGGLEKWGRSLQRRKL